MVSPKPKKKKIARKPRQENNSAGSSDRAEQALLDEAKHSHQLKGLESTQNSQSTQTPAKEVAGGEPQEETEVVVEST